MVAPYPPYGVGRTQQVLNEVQRTRLSRRHMIWLLRNPSPHLSPRQKVTKATLLLYYFLSLLTSSYIVQCTVKQTVSRQALQERCFSCGKFFLTVYTEKKAYATSIYIYIGLFYQNTCTYLDFQYF